MSGVYIKGMEMPKDGQIVLVEIDENGDVFAAYDGGRTKLSQYQAVPVPPHGRMIDADALLMRINHEVMEAYMDGVCYGVHPNQEYLYLLGEIIDDAPTIIPAGEE